MAVIGAEIERDVLQVSGPDAISWLQGQLSQDIERLDVGTSTWTLLLQPQGKVDAWLRVTKTAADTLVFDTDPGFGAVARARLERFKLRTKAEITELDWPAVAVRGDGAPRGDVPEGVLRLPLTERHGDGYDLLGPGAAVPDGVETVDRAAVDAVRIAHGVPAMGAELTDDTIPAEAGAWLIDTSVSFTKGCYVGQELTARVDSRGNNVPKPVRILVADRAVAVGDDVSVGADSVGVVTSAAGTIALAPIARKVAAGETVSVGGTLAVVHDEPVAVPS